MNTKLLFFIVFIGLAFSSFAQSGQQKFAKSAVAEDLEYLYASLQDAHYNLYAYTPKNEMDSVYQSIEASLPNDSLDLLEATNILQRLTTAANNGHTGVEFPGASYRQYLYSGGTIFPIEIAFEGGKNLIRKNFSTEQDIKVGSEILSVNGEPISKILTKIYPQIPAERLYFKHAKIEFYSFPRCYWQVYGQVNDFEIEIKSGDSVKKYSFQAVNLLEDYEMKRTEVLNASMKLNFFESTAYLNPGSFGGDEEKYRQFIDSAFSEIINRKCKNLIIDLKNNSGGDDSFSDYLVSYIANKPFRWNSSFSLKSSKFLKEHTRKHYDTTKVFFRKILEAPNGIPYDYDMGEYQPQAKSKRFRGKVYVLVNRQSHSQSAVTAAQIQDYGLGTIVGEETAEYPTLYASQFEYSLPNTGAIVKISKGYMIRVNGSEKQEGVIPDIEIKDHLLDEEDEILDGLLQKLK